MVSEEMLVDALAQRVSMNVLGAKNDLPLQLLVHLYKLQIIKIEALSLLV